MRYYDEECEAHRALKEAVKGMDVGGICTVYYEG